jgi:hypothetical protein
MLFLSLIRYASYREKQKEEKEKFVYPINNLPLHPHPHTHAHSGYHYHLKLSRQCKRGGGGGGGGEGKTMQTPTQPKMEVRGQLHASVALLPGEHVRYRLDGPVVCDVAVERGIRTSMPPNIAA